MALRVSEYKPHPIPDASTTEISAVARWQRIKQVAGVVGSVVGLVLFGSCAALEFTDGSGNMQHCAELRAEAFAHGQPLDDISFPAANGTTVEC
jgi:hypothetical protein